MNTGTPREIKYPPNGRSLSTCLGFCCFSHATAAAGDWAADGANLWVAANAHVEAPRIATSAATDAIGKVILANRAACRANCDDSGATTTSGISKAKISMFRTCERAM